MKAKCGLSGKLRQIAEEMEKHAEESGNWGQTVTAKGSVHIGQLQGLGRALCILVKDVSYVDTALVKEFFDSLAELYPKMKVIIQELQEKLPPVTVTV